MIGSLDLSPVIAHQYGWDEVLWFLIPVALAIGAVRWAEKRAKQNRSDRETSTGD